MKIIGVHAENFKKLKVIDLSPPSDVVELTGPNETGKSSFMDGIQMTLCGLKSRNDIPEPIRRGEDKATFQVTLGESPDKVQLVAKRVWRRSGTFDFVLENADGAEYKGPQAMLDKIVGSIALDPGKFGQMDEKKQLDTLLKMVHVPLDLKKWAEDRIKLFDARTETNRKAADLQGQVKLMGDVPAGTPDEEIPAATMLEEQAEAHAVKEQNDARRRKLEDDNAAAYRAAQDAVIQAQAALDRKDEEIHQIKNQRLQVEADISEVELKLKNLQERNKMLTDAHNEALASRGPLKETLDSCVNPDALARTLPDETGLGLVDPDMTVFAKRLSDIEETNRLVRIKRKKAELTTQLSDHTIKSEEYTNLLAEKDKEKTDALAAVEMPIAGLSFDENGVRYKDSPFCQCSSEERLRVSCAMAAAMNPKLKVIFARDASLLDSKHQGILKDFAKEKGYQLWMELADDSRKFGIVFSDGSIVPVKKEDK